MRHNFIASENVLHDGRYRRNFLYRIPRGNSPFEVHQMVWNPATVFHECAKLGQDKPELLWPEASAFVNMFTSVSRRLTFA